MLLSLVCSIAVLFVGSPLQIYIFSNMGYLFALMVALLGYGIFRSMRDDTPRELRMPRAFGPLGFVIGILGLILWAVGGYYATDYAVGTGYHWLYFIGLILLVLYFPLNWWRKLEDRTVGQSAAAASGGSS